MIYCVNIFKAIYDVKRPKQITESEKIKAIYNKQIRSYSKSPEYLRQFLTKTPEKSKQFSSLIISKLFTKYKIFEEIHGAEHENNLQKEKYKAIFNLKKVETIRKFRNIQSNLERKTACKGNLSIVD